VITNGMTAPQRDKLSRLGIEPHFERMFASSAVGAGKPSRVIFEQALEQMGVSPSGAVMVGDSLDGDIAGAQIVGLRAVWINRRGRSCEGAVWPDAEAADLTSIEAYLPVRFAK
jgi:putative hydrolase of the HAD superfamily